LPKLTNYVDDIKVIEFKSEKIINVLYLLYTPFLLILSLNAQILFNLAFGSNWSVAASIFQKLCLGAFFYPIIVFVFLLFNIFEKSKLQVIFQIISLFFVIILYIIGYSDFNLFIKKFNFKINKKYTKVKFVKKAILFEKIYSLISFFIIFYLL